MTVAGAGSTGAARVPSVPLRMPARIFTGPGLLLAGLNHFLMPRVYEPLMPDYLPAHRQLIYASGVAEMLTGAGAMVPQTRRYAGWLGVATLIGVFPANVHMAQHPERFPGIPRWTMIVRLPMQLWMIWAVWDTTQRDAAPSPH